MIILVLEDAQLELRLARHENVQLRKQFYDSHQSFVEKTSELESQLQSLEQLSGNYVPKIVQVRAWKLCKLINWLSSCMGINLDCK